jgi:hypothetical protein
MFERFWIRFKPAEEIVSRQKEWMPFVKAAGFESARATCNSDPEFTPIVQIYEAADVLRTPTEL